MNKTDKNPHHHGTNNLVRKSRQEEQNVRTDICKNVVTAMNKGQTRWQAEAGEVKPDQCGESRPRAGEDTVKPWRRCRSETCKYLGKEERQITRNSQFKSVETEACLIYLRNGKATCVWRRWIWVNRRCCQRFKGVQTLCNGFRFCLREIEPLEGSMWSDLHINNTLAVILGAVLRIIRGYEWE